MSEKKQRWQEIADEMFPVGQGASLNKYLVAAAKRMAAMEEEVQMCKDSDTRICKQLESLGFVSDWEGGPVDSLIRAANKVHRRLTETTPGFSVVVYGHSLPEDVETIKNLREALAFYACDSNWIESAFGPDSRLTRVIWDGGCIAEAALSDEAGLFPKDERQVP